MKFPTIQSKPTIRRLKNIVFGILIGYSQGGAGALRAATEFDNSNKYKTIFPGSAAYPLLAKNMGWGYDATKIKIPYFMAAGTGTSDDNGKSIDNPDELAGICPLEALKFNYNKLEMARY